MGFNGDLYPTAGASVVMTTSGDMVKYESGARARLGIGSANQILQVKSSLPSWETVDLADTVLTTAGDVLIENSVPELARLPKGTQYNNLQMGASLPAWSASSSSVLTASGDVLYASGANTLAKLAKASDGDTLQLASGIPSWVTVASGSTLTKVTKSYTDVSSLELPIYTLPADQALVNVFADVTTTWDVGSTAVTIGDASDENGFQESTDWSSAGLTSATRGVYVSQFKGMRSTSGTTAIVGYGFVSGGSTFLQNDGGDSEDLYPATNRTQVGQLFQAGQVLVGENVVAASFWIRDAIGGATGTLTAYIRENDGTEVASSTTNLDASTLTGSFVEHSFNFPSTTIDADDMIMLSSASMGTNVVKVETQTGDLTDGEVWEQSFGTYAQKTNLKMRMSVTYAPTSLTQGAVDFYLQIAKE